MSSTSTPLKSSNTDAFYDCGMAPAEFFGRLSTSLRSWRKSWRWSHWLASVAMAMAGLH